jgi:hypothetical protein
MVFNVPGRDTLAVSWPEGASNGGHVCAQDPVQAMWGVVACESRSGVK